MNTVDSKCIKDYATGYSVTVTPEEPVRQEYERILVEDYGYYKTEWILKSGFRAVLVTFPIRQILLFIVERDVIQLKILAHVKTKCGGF